MSPLETFTLLLLVSLPKINSDSNPLLLTRCILDPMTYISGTSNIFNTPPIPPCPHSLFIPLQHRSDTSTFHSSQRYQQAESGTAAGINGYSPTNRRPNAATMVASTAGRLCDDMQTELRRRMVMAGDTARAIRVAREAIDAESMLAQAKAQVRPAKSFALLYFMCSFYLAIMFCDGWTCCRRRRGRMAKHTALH